MDKSCELNSNEDSGDRHLIEIMKHFEKKEHQGELDFLTV